MNDDKPFVCPVVDCGMRFTNEDHLNVHSKKHEMSLALNAGEPTSSGASPAHLLLDQTPTPTKFLKNCDEISLFHELGVSKNPFDAAYKIALDSDEVAPLPGPHTGGELNTPTLIVTDHPRPSAVNTASPLTLAKGTEPVKPSPLVKSFTSNTATNELQGKTVTASQTAKTTLTAETIKKNLAARLASNSQLRQTEDSQADNSDQNSSKTSTSQIESTVSVATDLADHTRALQLLTRLQSSAANIATSQQNGLEMVRIKEEPLDVASAISAHQQQQQQLQTQAASQQTAAQQQQQCTMQVLLQLPTGETVPISIPATINKMQYQGQGLEVQPAAQPLTPIQTSQTSNLPSNVQIGLNKSGTGNSSQNISQNTAMALKQRLQAQLKNQISPKVEQSSSPPNSVFVPAQNQATMPSNSAASASVFIPATSPDMMMDSPGSEVNFSDSSDYSVDSKRQRMSPEAVECEDRRRKFLERNRAAAARCRQKRKHWISNLERKADDLSSTNLKLQNEVKLLRGEVAQLKTLLMAHKDCPVTQHQRSQGQLQHVILTDANLATQSQSHDLAQVVPTADPIHGVEQIHLAQLGGTIVHFLPDSVLDPHHTDLQNGSSKQD